uniref:NADH-ubiquinone oxidoreductase chain 4 n=1 Tax=Trichodectes canis TaxID=209909 RepID=A0A386B2A0_9NEOP|nr:NADH dehydrogenase subunit 4 [Trichodectes canis]
MSALFTGLMVMLIGLILKFSWITISFILLGLSFSLLLNVFMMKDSVLTLGMNLDSICYYMEILVLLTILLSISVGLMMDNKEKIKALLFLGLISCLFFAVDNLLLLLLTYEMSLIPVFYLIMSHGYQPERFRSSFFIIMYTLISSIPLIYFTVLLVLNHSFDSSYFISMHSISDKFFWVLFMMFVSFLVKLPLFGFHVWLPMAHVEAPLVGSMVLASILLKMGGFGLYRFWSLATDNKFLNFWMFLLVVSAVGGVVSGFLALFSSDVKTIVAYSSVSHMNFLYVGFCSSKITSMNGFLTMSFSHGISSMALFFLVTVFYNTISSRNLYFMKGLLGVFPVLMMMSMLNWSMNFGLPPFMSFLGEILILTSSLSMFPWVLVILLLVMFISSSYSMNTFGLMNLPSVKSLNLPKTTFQDVNMLLFFLVIGVEMLFLSVEMY